MRGLLKKARKEACRMVRILAVEAIHLLFDHDCVFRLIGRLNRRWGFLKVAFLMYPAHDGYTDAFVARNRQKEIIWKPMLAGFYRQNGKLGLTFLITPKEKVFLSRNNSELLQQACDRMESIRLMLGAERKSFSGILPRVLFTRGMIATDDSAEITAAAVCQAVRDVERLEGVPVGSPSVILGGLGYVGSRVVRDLHAFGNREVRSVDTRGTGSEREWPEMPKGSRSVVVNIASAQALEQNIQNLNSGTVVLNEAYPEPGAETLSRIREKGCPAYHVVGVRSSAFPSFPFAYRGGIPCCAAWPSPEMRVMILKM